MKMSIKELKPLVLDVLRKCKRNWKIGVAAALLGATAFAVYIVSALSDLPDVETLRQYKPSITTTLWTRDDVLMAELYKENRVIVDIGEIPDHVRNAFLAAEDGDFYKHKGLDYSGIFRAAWANLRRGRVSQGGSTITQQVAKSLLLTPERSLRRKIREAVLALRMEEQLSKEEILSLYLNHIYLGHGAHGVGAASFVYFGVPASKLTLAQAALLAGLPQAPSRYDPFRNPEEALSRRQYVLSQMAEKGWVDDDDAETTALLPLGLVNRSNFFLSVAPYFSETIRQDLEKRFGSEDALMGGYRVTTTLDSRIQASAQRALEEGLEEMENAQGYRGPLRRVTSADEEAVFRVEQESFPDRTAEALVVGVTSMGIRVMAGGVEFFLPSEEMPWAVFGDRTPSDVFHVGDVVLVRYRKGAGDVLSAKLTQSPLMEGALVCLDTRTGEVLALVGGYSFQRSQFNRALQAKRQAGSSIKPLLYAAAMSKGFTAASLLYDSPIVYETADLDERWKPKNYSEKFYGATTLREALVLSRNVVTIKILQEIGVPYAMDYLNGLGLQTSALNADLSLALGSPSVSPLEMASLYGIFATGGIRREPVFLRLITDRNGAEIESFPAPAGERAVMDERIAYALTKIMEDIIIEGTGTAARGLPVPCAGKTGTTNDSRDAWFIGYTPDLVTAVWVGYDDGTSLGERETGGRVAAPIWKRFMADAVTLHGRGGDFPMPADIEFARIDADTGKLAGPHSARTFYAAFIAGTSPAGVERFQPGPARVGRSEPVLDIRNPDSLEELR